MELLSPVLVGEHSLHPRCSSGKMPTCMYSTSGRNAKCLHVHCRAVRFNCDFASRETGHWHGQHVRVLSLKLGNDQYILSGKVVVRNLAYHKEV
jgi:hypothetical protein